MRSLTIKDLSSTETLDVRTMGSVRGGSSAFSMPSYFGPSFSLAMNDLKFDATQQMQQGQNTMVNNGNNAAFVSGITSNVTPSQIGHNTINFL